MKTFARRAEGCLREVWTQPCGPYLTLALSGRGLAREHTALGSGTGREARIVGLASPFPVALPSWPLNAVGAHGKVGVSALVASALAAC